MTRAALVACALLYVGVLVASVREAWLARRTRGRPRYEDTAYVRFWHADRCDATPCVCGATQAAARARVWEQEMMPESTQVHVQQESQS